MKYGRALSALMAIVVIAAAAAPALASSAPAGRFLDDDGHPAEVTLEWLATVRVIDGCNPPANDRSCPDDPVTRAEAAKIIVKLGESRGWVGSSTTSSSDPFLDDDMALGGGGERLIEQLAVVGALHGCDPPVNRHICPDGLVTRGQAAKMLVAAFGLTAPLSAASSWTDTTGRFYDEAARIAGWHGLFSERSEFDGDEALTRGEFAAASALAGGVELCRPTPFTSDRIAELTRLYPSQLISAHVYDIRTGCHYSLNPSNRQRTASVFKVMVMAGTLLEAQQDGRQPTDWEWSQLHPMITESANGPVRSLWYSFGASPWYLRQGEIFGLDDTIVRGDDGSAWGLTTTSAADQVDLVRQVLLGEWGPLEAHYRQHALSLMDDVVSSQTWGVTAGVPDGWSVAQKNGFAGITINSVGWVRRPAIDDGYVVAILGQGWPDHHTGIAAAELVSGWVADAMTGVWDPSPGS